MILWSLLLLNLQLSGKCFSELLGGLNSPGQPLRICEKDLRGPALSRRSLGHDLIQQEPGHQLMSIQEPRDVHRIEDVPESSTSPTDGSTSFVELEYSSDVGIKRNEGREKKSGEHAIDIEANEQDSEKDACLICFHEFDTEPGAREKIKQCTSCNQIFHPFCIERWLTDHNTCPHCRATVPGIPARAFPPARPFVQYAFDPGWNTMVAGQREVQPWYRNHRKSVPAYVTSILFMASALFLFVNYLG